MSTIKLKRASNCIYNDGQPFVVLKRALLTKALLLPSTYLSRIHRLVKVTPPASVTFWTTSSHAAGLHEMG